MGHDPWTTDRLAAFGLSSEPSAEAKLETERRREQQRAEAASFHARAYLKMPDELRQSAKRWGVEALMEGVWLNAFGCGYKQAIRDRTLSGAPDHD